MVAMTKALLLALGDQPPPQLCLEMNRIMVRAGLREESNMALMLLEFRERKTAPGLEVRATGGSMPPIYILRAAHARPDGAGVRELEQVQIPGAPLGLIDFDDITYDDVRFELEPGDVVVLMSDGLPEIMNAEEQMLDYDRLEERLARISPDAPLSEILDRIVRIGDDWAEGEALKDDLTLLALRVR